MIPMKPMTFSLRPRNGIFVMVHQSKLQRASNQISNRSMTGPPVAWKDPPVASTIKGRNFGREELVISDADESALILQSQPFEAGGAGGNHSTLAALHKRSVHACPCIHGFGFTRFLPIDSAMKLLFAPILLSAFAACGMEPMVIADFEGPDYGAWKATGTAFGTGPAHGQLPHQMPVEGFLGKGLVNSFNGGDGATGTLTSPPFRLGRKFITFLIGGGGWADETCMNLLVDGKVVRTATGLNVVSGGRERLEPAAWDVGEFAGREAVIVIVDNRKGVWGHINVDHIVQTDDRGSIALAASPVPLVKDVAREIVAEKKLLNFPVKNGAKKRVIKISADGAQVRRFDIELADADADWWAPLDVSAWAGKKLRVVADALPEGSKALTALRQSDTLPESENLYREPLRPQLQFSAKRGWNNDPNGLVFFRGEYHLFFQQNPYGWGWGNMHWGHATSRDLVHWEERGEALYPDEMGPMFSGSAVVEFTALFLQADMECEHPAFRRLVPEYLRGAIASSDLPDGRIVGKLRECAPVTQ